MKYPYKVERDVKSVIVLPDNTIGLPNNNQESLLKNSPEAYIRSSIKQELSQLADSGININLIVKNDFPTENLDILSQFIPKVNKIIKEDKSVDQSLTNISENIMIGPNQTIFVSMDRTLRESAINKGYLASPHVSIAKLIAKKIPICFVKIEGEETLLQGIKDIIPYYLEKYDRSQILLLGIASLEAVADAITRRLKTELLDFDFDRDDLLFVALDKIDDSTKGKIMRQKIILSTGRYLLISLSPSVSSDGIPFHDKHGHFLFLRPDPTLLKPDPLLTRSLELRSESFRKWPLKRIKITPIRKNESIMELASVGEATDPSSIQSYVDRYSGVIELDELGKIKSRHCENSDNLRVINALIKDLKEMGYSPFTYSFRYRGKDLLNVIADLPGKGYFKAEPNISENIRQIFLKYPYIHPSNDWIKEIINILGDEWLNEQGLGTDDPLKLRNTINDIFLKNSSWWVKESALSGLQAQTIIVCCHLDSTANLEFNYDRLADPAPGADDNCSGVSAVLAIAKYLSQFRGNLTHTVRFCFFNAEEVGLYGSQEYASYLKEEGVPIKAVINLDMMGYNNDGNRIFEIHAGYPDPIMRDKCIPLAEMVKSWSDKLGKVGPAQIYKGLEQGNDDDHDRNQVDGAIRRSDHYSFQNHGFPSIHISEDFFANFPVEPGRDRNPNYHRFADKKIDSSYVADIVNSTAFAIKELADE